MLALGAWGSMVLGRDPSIALQTAGMSLDKAPVWSRELDEALQTALALNGHQSES